jgi:hypothetical protein
VSDQKAEARAVLLAALESLDEVEEKHGPAKHTYLCICWAHQIEGSTVRGWNSTDDPTFATVAMLREVADYIEEGAEVEDPAADDETDP